MIITQQKTLHCGFGLCCINKSMSSWTNKFGQGFMIISHKPHLQGYEYHSIADGDTSGSKLIMWRINLLEDKDQPNMSSRGTHQHTLLLFKMTKLIHGTGRGFLATQSVLALHSHGVYVQFLIKKRRYWPKGVLGSTLTSTYQTSCSEQQSHSFKICVAHDFMSIVQKISVM